MTEVLDFGSFLLKANDSITTTSGREYDQILAKGLVTALCTWGDLSSSGWDGEPFMTINRLPYRDAHIHAGGGYDYRYFSVNGVRFTCTYRNDPARGVAYLSIYYEEGPHKLQLIYNEDTGLSANYRSHEPKRFWTTLCFSQGNVHHTTLNKLGGVDLEDHITGAFEFLGVDLRSNETYETPFEQLAAERMFALVGGYPQYEDVRAYLKEKANGLSM